MGKGKQVGMKKLKKKKKVAVFWCKEHVFEIIIIRIKSKSKIIIKYKNKIILIIKSPPRRCEEQA